MAYKKVVIISSIELDNRIATLFGIESLVKSGIDVEYLNVSDITYHEHINSGVNNSCKSYEVRSIREFTKYILQCDLQSTLFCVYLNYSFPTIPIYRVLSEHKADMLYCVNGVLPVVTQRRSNRASFSLKRIIQVLRNIYCRILLKTPFIYPVKYVLLTCKKAEISIKTSHNTHIVRNNSTDYEFFLSGKQAVNNPDHRYIVFIDQNFPHHPDLDVRGIKHIDSKLYFCQLNHVFDTLEKKYNCEVVIAAHPTSAYLGADNPFEGRKVYYSQTNSLVASSIGVVLQYSSAISFVVLHNKPAIFLTSNDIAHTDPRANSYIIEMSHKLYANCYNMDNDDDYSLPVLSTASYDDYKYDYLTNKESENESNAVIMMRIVEGAYE